MQAAHYQTEAVYNALVEVSEKVNDPKAKTKSTGLAKQLKKSISGNFSLLVRFIV